MRRRQGRGRRRVWLAAAIAAVCGGSFAARKVRRFLGAALEGYPEVPADGGVVMTGSFSSTVKLDYEQGVAEKTYNHATRFVRLLYRLSFQAPFPYTSNRAALEAGQHRRTIAGLLTKHWFGENLIAPVVEVRDDPGGGYTLVTELVPGSAPTPGPRASAMLRALTGHFLDAGLPRWQVGYYNPRAIGNLIERADGSYRIIDLESNLVTPFLPPAATIRAIRIGQFPSFDDIDVGRLRGYLDANADALARSLDADERGGRRGVRGGGAALARERAALGQPRAAPGVSASSTSPPGSASPAPRRHASDDWRDARAAPGAAGGRPLRLMALVPARDRARRAAGRRVRRPEHRRGGRRGPSQP